MHSFAYFPFDFYLQIEFCCGFQTLDTVTKDLLTISLRSELAEDNGLESRKRYKMKTLVL